MAHYPNLVSQRTYRRGEEKWLQALEPNQTRTNKREYAQSCQDGSDHSSAGREEGCYDRNHSSLPWISYHSSTSRTKEKPQRGTIGTKDTESLAESGHDLFRFLSLLPDDPVTSCFFGKILGKQSSPPYPSLG
jgi:hypothetical protein